MSFLDRAKCMSPRLNDVSDYGLLARTSGACPGSFRGPSLFAERLWGYPSADRPEERSPGRTGATDHSAPDHVATGRWAEAFDPAGAEEEAEDAEAEDAKGVALTSREREVLALLAAGASNKTIARALGVSVHTAKFHVASLTEKLGANGRLEAVAIALRAGLIMV